MSATDDWTKQRVTIDSGYNGERMDVVMFVPKRGTPPYQPLLFVSGIQIVLFPATLDSIDAGFAAMPLDYLVKSGRMLVQPIFQGTYNRWKAPYDQGDEVTHQARMDRAALGPWPDDRLPRDPAGRRRLATRLHRSVSALRARCRLWLLNRA